jgi:hypothetical protein
MSCQGGQFEKSSGKQSLQMRLISDKPGFISSICRDNKSIHGEVHYFSFPQIPVCAREHLLSIPEAEPDAL